MGIICNPLSTELTDIPVAGCGDDLGQIQKLIIQPVKKADGSFNAFLPNAGSPTTPTLLADWTALFAASDLTKPVVSPFIENPEFEAGEARTFGGGNQTRDGVEYILGSNPSSFSAMMHKTSAATRKALKELNGTAVGVYLIDEFGKIGGVSNGEASNAATYEIRPIPVRSLFTGDKKFGNFEEPDSCAIKFSFAPRWDDNFVVSTPTDFNALEDLKSA